MTKTEYRKCEKLMKKAIRMAKQANTEYADAEKYLADANELEWETEQRKADQHYGYVEGINQVLVTLGFKHERMKQLSELL